MYKRLTTIQKWSRVKRPEVRDILFLPKEFVIKGNNMGSIQASIDNYKSKIGTRIGHFTIIDYIYDDGTEETCYYKIQTGTADNYVLFERNL